MPFLRLCFPIVFPVYLSVRSGGSGKRSLGLSAANVLALSKASCLGNCFRESITSFLCGTGVLLVTSTPPAKPHSICPVQINSQILAMDCSPEAQADSHQKRSFVHIEIQSDFSTNIWSVWNQLPFPTQYVQLFLVEVVFIEQFSGDLCRERNRVHTIEFSP